MKSYNDLAFFVFLVFVVIFSVPFSLGAFAEDVQDVEFIPETVSSGSVEVYSPDINARLDSMQETLDAIAAALVPQEVTEEQSVNSNPYSVQLETIENTLSKIQEQTAPATPETAEPVLAFDKPFTEYSISEVLLLVVTVLGFLAFVVYLVRNFL